MTGVRLFAYTEVGTREQVYMEHYTRKIETAVITGPTGAIGSALCRRLLKEGIEVYAICNPQSTRLNALPIDKRLNIILCDINHLEQLSNRIPKKINAFFHLAWEKTSAAGRNDLSFQIRNIKNTISAVHAASSLNCNVFVGAGSQAEYGRTDGILKPCTPCWPENGYGMAKLCAGQMSRLECRKLEMAHIWMRVLSAYGPDDSMDTMIMSTIRKLLNCEEPQLTAGEQIWDYLYSDDAANAFFLAALHGPDGMAYPLGSGVARPLRMYAEMLRDAIDPSLPLGIGKVSYGPQQVMHLQADISVLQAHTGFTPSVEFAQGIEQTIRWVRSVVT